MKLNRTKNAVRNSFFGGINFAYTTIAPFIMRTLMLYYLGVEYTGLNGLFASILQVLNLTELGVGSAMNYSMYRAIANDDEAQICALMKLYRKYYRIIGSVIAVIGLIILPFVPKLRVEFYSNKHSPQIIRCHSNDKKRSRHSFRIMRQYFIYFLFSFSN